MSRDTGTSTPSSVRKITVPLITIVAVIVVWWVVVHVGLVPDFLLPGPDQVVMAFAEDVPLLAEHTATTLAEAALGLALGTLVGFVFAVLMDRFETLYLALNPIITVSQTIPTIALAPLLVLWFGYGLAPKVLLIVLTTFFPITVSLIGGFRSVDPDVVDLMRTMNASDWQIFVQAKLPLALEQFFSGLQISAAYAIVGAVVAEWLGGFSGLGVYMTRVRKSFSYDKMFAVIALISFLSLALMKGIHLLARICMPWNKQKGNES